MFARDLHALLAWLSLAAMLAASVEGAIRLTRGALPGVFASRCTQLAVLTILLASAGGLALFISGRQPHELLHLIYAVLVLGTLPVADVIWERAAARTRAAARLGAGLVGLVLVARLFATG